MFSDVKSTDLDTLYKKFNLTDNSTIGQVGQFSVKFGAINGPIDLPDEIIAKILRSHPSLFKSSQLTSKLIAIHCGLSILQSEGFINPTCKEVSKIRLDSCIGIYVIDNKGKICGAYVSRKLPENYLVCSELTYYVREENKYRSSWSSRIYNRYFRCLNFDIITGFSVRSQRISLMKIDPNYAKFHLIREFNELYGYEFEDASQLVIIIVISLSLIILEHNNDINWFRGQLCRDNFLVNYATQIKKLYDNARNIAKTQVIKLINAKVSPTNPNLLEYP